MLWLKVTCLFIFRLSSRPLEDELFAVVSEPKRPVLESPISRQAANTSVTSKETYSRSDRVPAATSQAPVGSAADLFGRAEGWSDRVSHAVQEEPRSRKRKGMEVEIQMDELESIMSEDMDYFDEPPSGNQDQQAQLIMHSSTEQKRGLSTVEASSKRQRVHREENGASKRPQAGLEKESGSHKKHSQKSEQPIVSIKTEQVDPSEYKTAYHESSKPPEASSASKSENIEPFEDDEASFIEVRLSVCLPSFVHPVIQRQKCRVKLPQHTRLFHLSVVYSVIFQHY